MVATLKPITSETPATSNADLTDPSPPTGLTSPPLKPEELTDRLVPADPRLSPDGRAVVFAVAPAGKKSEQKEQALWLSRDGAPARQLTSGTAHDANPRWSPDGSSILFCSDRADRKEATFKLYVLRLDGGEAMPLGDLHGELTQPSWSPDGKSIAVIHTEPDTDEQKKRKEMRDDAIVVDEQPRYPRLWVVDAATGRARCLTHGARRVWSFAWTPDSTHLVIVTTTEVDYDAIFGASEVSLVPRTGGLARHLATFRTLPGDPVVAMTVDGPIVALRANDHRNNPVNSVWVVPLAGGVPRDLLPGYPGAVEELVPLPASSGQIGVRIVQRTHGRVYGLDVASGGLTPLTPAPRHEGGSVLSAPSFSADGSRLALIWSDSITPAEVYVGAAGDTTSAVTTFGASFRGRLRPVETVRWHSDDGVEIEGLLTYPASYEPGRRYPLLVEVHGGPYWQWEDRAMLDWHDWAQLLASHGYAVLAPNPRGSTGYGAEFQKRLTDDVGGGEARDLITGARAMVDRGVADLDRLAIGGWSWGGYLTAWTITQTDIFKAAIMGAGLSNTVSDHGQDDIPAMNLLLYPDDPYRAIEAYWQSSPIRYVANVKTPTLILHGDADARVHPAQGMEFHRALKTLGIPVQFVRYPREGHPITERAHQIDLMRRLISWLDRWLTEPPPIASQDS